MGNSRQPGQRYHAQLSRQPHPPRAQIINRTSCECKIKSQIPYLSNLTACLRHRLWAARRRIHRGQPMPLHRPGTPLSRLQPCSPSHARKVYWNRQPKQQAFGVPSAGTLYRFNRAAATPGGTSSCYTAFLEISRVWWPGRLSVQARGRRPATGVVSSGARVAPEPVHSINIQRF